MIKNVDQLIGWFNEDKYTELAKAQALTKSLEIFKECTYFEPTRKDYSDVGSGGILYKLRHSPGVNVFIPEHMDTMIGYHPATQYRIPYPFVIMSERNRDLRILIFANAVLLHNFLKDIRNNRTNFDLTVATYRSEGVMKSIRLVQRPDKRYYARNSKDEPYITGLMIDNKGTILRELFSQYTIASPYSVCSVWDIVTKGQYDVRIISRWNNPEYDATAEHIYDEYIKKLAKDLENEEN